MFRRYLSNFKKYLIPIIGWVSFVQFAQADTAPGAITSFFGFSLPQLLAEIAAWVSNMALTLMSLWITLTGALLNVSITLTLNIKAFVDSTEGIYLVWETIRDVSGMVIIFMLLYASFKIILSRDGAMGGVGNLIKNVVIVGVLINFSFFITSLLIDASNIVSMALYNAIVTPTALSASQQQISQNCASTDGQPVGSLNTCVITSKMMSGVDGGLSGIFLNYLKPQSIYNSTGNQDVNTASYSQPLLILVQGIVGCIIMFTIGFSFLLAALAFVVRLILLVFLLAFSPIWFASWVIPQLEDKAKEFTNQLKAQLIFMPVYLLLLYASLRILSATSVFTNPGVSAFSGSGTSLSFIPVNYIVLAINDFFIIFLLNLPLVTAFSMGGLASKWVNTEKFGAKGMWKQVGGFAGRQTLGRMGDSTQKYISKNFPVASNTLVGNAVLKGTAGWAANSGFGSGTSRTATNTAAKARATAASAGQRANQNMTRLQNAVASGNSLNVKMALAQLSTKEKADLDTKKYLTNDLVLQHLDEGTHKAIDNHATLTDKDKNDIANARTTLLNTAVASSDAVTVQNLLKNASGDTLTNFANDPANAATIMNPLFISHLRESQLKNMDGIDPGLRKAIGDQIYNIATSGPTGGSHPAYDFVSKNRSTWG